MQCLERVVHVVSPVRNTAAVADCAIEVTDHTTADHTTAFFSSEHLRPDPGSGNVDSWCSPGEHFRTITWVGQSWG